MKTVIAKLAANVNRVRMSINHLFDAYERTLNDLGETSTYPQMFENCEVM